MQKKLLVGARRFELLTPCAQGRCATRLRYAPTFLIIDERTSAILFSSSCSFSLLERSRPFVCTGMFTGMFKDELSALLTDIPRARAEYNFRPVCKCRVMRWWPISRIPLEGSWRTCAASCIPTIRTWRPI